VSLKLYVNKDLTFVTQTPTAMIVDIKNCYWHTGRLTCHLNLRCDS